jgi:glycosyltransferase involved in cell wall biosynthesis
LEQKPHIVHLPRIYPSKIAPLSGIFFEQQVDALRSTPNLSISVIALVQKPLLSSLFYANLRLWFKTLMHDTNSGITQIIYIFSLPMPFLVKRYYINLRCYWRIKKHIKKCGKPNLIHLQTYEMGIAALWVKKRLNIPYIITEHSSNLYSDATRLSKRLLTEIYLESSYNIAVSPYFANFLSLKFSTKFDYIPNSVNIEKITIKADKKTAVIQLIHVAHCVPIKQQDLLLRGFKQALDKNKNIHLTIIGDGPELPKLKVLASGLNITEQVTFCGTLSNSEVKCKMREADIFILTSKKETFGVVLIEAMAVGLPSISTRCGGPEDILTNDNLGILCGPSPTSIADAILEASTKEYDPVKIREYAIKVYSTEAVSKQIVNVYKQVMLTNNP